MFNFYNCLFQLRELIHSLRRFISGIAGHLVLIVFLISGFLNQAAYAQISFGSSTLDFNGFQAVNQSGNGGVTALEFGPDGKLYVAQRYGQIIVYDIQRTAVNSYEVIDAEVINLVKNIPNHNDDGTSGGPSNRQVTGLTVAGTAGNPIIYVSSSDSRIGAGGSGGDINLDTNSGVITELKKVGGNWQALDLVRGLPRSEENHATNGLEFVTIGSTDYLLVAQGGFTNAGSPSNNFAYITEYALSAAVLAIDLDAIYALSTQNDGRNFKYDVPTLDDPTRPNLNGITDPDDPAYDGIDINDPFGGNDGLNQGMLIPGGPVKMFSPGYRNTYDLHITASGAVYVTDNGANGGWGGYPENEATPNVNNNYRPGEPGSTSADGGEAQVNNKDHLTLITTDLQSYTFGSFYGGHPCPVRANVNAGLYTLGTHSSGGAYFRTVPYDPNGSGDASDPAKALPANWPPVPASMIDVVNADYRNPGDNNPDGANDIVLTWQNNTNALVEYTASNFGGEMQGDLLAGKNGGTIHRVITSNSISTHTLEQNKFSTGGNNALGLTAQGDGVVFPGTVWIGTFDNNIYVFEPNDFVICVLPGDPAYDPNGDNDGDGYTNQDEDDNNTNMCDGASVPSDFDDDLVSDLNDPDDDNDGINDANDPFQMGAPFDVPVINELRTDGPINLGGYQDLGLTGLMNNGDPNPNYLNWLDVPGSPPGSPIDDVLGGAVGIVTIYQTAGDALNNDQEKAYQYGVNVDVNTGSFMVSTRMIPPFHNHTGNESQGMFIGTGFQDDYIKLVLGASGLIVTGENGGSSLGTLAATSTPAISANLDLFFEINPASASIQASYSLDDGQTKINIGSPFSATGAVLSAIQNQSDPLAVGLIGTNGGSAGGEFAANWEFLNVTTGDPIITQILPDITREINSPNENIDLSLYFDDDGGVGNLTFSVENNTNTAIGATVNGNLLTLGYPASPTSSTLTIRATDQDQNFAEQTFNVIVTNSTPLYRVNAGGPQVPSIDGFMDWEADNPPSTYLIDPGSNGLAAFSIPTLDPSVDSDAVPVDIFQTERWDNAGGTAMTWSFPVSNPGDYVLRLYMGNGWDGTNDPGERIFSVQVEGVIPAIYTDIDLSAQFGHKVGALLSYNVTVNDGALDLTFIHGAIQNPLVNGIEIIGGGVTHPPITVNTIANQNNDEGDSPNLSVIASGGNPNENFAYSATGLPPGISLEPTNGAFLGIVASGASTGGPSNDGNYPVTVSVSKPGSSAANTSFQWTINSPVPPGDCFVESGGEVVMEAENYTAAFSGSGNAAGSSWQTYSDAAASASTAVRAEPNTGVWTGLNLNGPRLDYDITFSDPGIYQVYVRSSAPGSNDDSYHVGLNGVSITNSSGFGMDINGPWDWANDANGGNAVEINVPSTGTHTFNIWMREDGVQVDKIVLTKLSEPVGVGPAESAMGNCGTGNNQPPVASFTATPVTGTAPLQIALDASASSDNEGPIADYSWDFGDGNTGSGQLTTHTFVNEGQFTVTLTVMDQQGLTASSTQLITVEPAGGPLCFIESGGEVVIEAENYDATIAGSGNASASLWQTYSDGDASAGTAVRAEPNTGVWTGLNLNGPRLDYEINFSTTGTYQVYVRSSGPGSNDDSYHVGLNGTSVTNSSGFGMDINGPWDWASDANGGIPVEIDVLSSGTHTFNIWMREDGVQIDKIVLTQTSEPIGLGPAESARASCGTSNQPPVASFIATPTSGTEPLLVNLDASASSDAEGPIANYAWDFGDGNTGSGQTTSHTYVNNGQFTLTLTVTDQGGLTASSSQLITVNPASGPLCFTETNGLVVMEAENYSNATAGTGSASGNSWQNFADASASGNAGVEASPDLGNWTGLNLNGPRLDYDITFNTAGTYYVYVRSAGSGSGSDSYHAGLNGTGVTNISGFGMDNNGPWQWVDDANGGNPVQLVVPSAGQHTFNIWMREDGVQIDKIVLKLISGKPSGEGPIESSRNACTSQGLQGFALGEDQEGARNNFGILHDSVFKFSVHPNPASEKVIIEYEDPNLRAQKLQIVNFQGQKIWAKEVRGKSRNGYLEMDVSNWSRGIYYIHMLYGNELATVKISLY